MGGVCRDVRGKSGGSIPHTPSGTPTQDCYPALREDELKVFRILKDIALKAP